MTPPTIRTVHCADRPEQSSAVAPHRDRQVKEIRFTGASTPAERIPSGYGANTRQRTFADPTTHSFAVGPLPPVGASPRVPGTGPTITAAGEVNGSVGSTADPNGYAPDRGNPAHRLP